MPSSPVTSRRSTRSAGCARRSLMSGQEAVAAGQELGLAFAILEDPECLVQVPRTDVVELAGNHRAWTLLPAPRGRCRPIRPGWAQSGGDDRGPVPMPSTAVTAGPGLGDVLREVSVRGRSRVNVNRAWIRWLGRLGFTADRATRPRRDPPHDRAGDLTAQRGPARAQPTASGSPVSTNVLSPDTM